MKQMLTFILKTAYKERSHEDINAELLNKILDYFILNDAIFDGDDWDFISLEPSEQIGGSNFIQAGAPQHITNGKFTLEVGFGSAETGVKIYRYYTDDKEIVLQFLVNYWQNQALPDLATWEIEVFPNNEKPKKKKWLFGRK